MNGKAQQQLENELELRVSDADAHLHKAIALLNRIRLHVVPDTQKNVMQIVKDLRKMSDFIGGLNLKK
jgi:hypothetical protein